MWNKIIVEGKAPGTRILQLLLVKNNNLKIYMETNRSINLIFLFF